MLKIIREQGRTRLAFLCDYCRKEITDASMAMYAWRVNRQTSEISDGTIYTFHKGVCDHATTDTDTNHRKSLYNWQLMELAELPREIIESLGMTWEQAQGKLEEYKEKDIVKMQLMRKEVEEWEQSALPLDHVDELEDEDEEENN